MRSEVADLPGERRGREEEKKGDDVNDWGRN